MQDNNAIALLQLVPADHERSTWKTLNKFQWNKNSFLTKGIAR
jgi:hypothetical protein